MIFVGSRDARKGLGLGFGAGREMDDSELEEGEACSSQINEYDPNIDPDVALAYIDDKIQDVLGHFQKDFEGGVSAENLGAKFGGYGSFLPSYQRSPVWSHPRTPAKIQNYSLPKSPNSLKLEGGHRNNSVCYAASQSVGLGTASTSSISLAAPKAPSANVPVKQDVSISYNQADQYPPEQESATKKHIKLSDQKTLKVRLKVGSDNLSTRKNDIYSGLGLDGTPSSSLDDSSDSEGISHEPQDAPFESPTSILQIMTSCPVYEGMLLSPLPDDLIYLIEKEKVAKEVRSVPLPRDGSERSGFLVNGANTREGGGKVSGARKTKSVERNDFSAESKSGNNKDGIGLLAKKDQDIDTFACEELVSKTLKLPLLSNSYSSVNDVTKSKEMEKTVVRDKGFPCQAEDEPMEPTSNQEQGWVEKRKASLAGKVQEDRRVSSSNNVLVHPKKDGHRKGEKSNESLKADSNVSKGRKSLNTDVVDRSKQKASQKGIAHEVDDMRLLSGKEQPLLGEKKKSKEIPRTPVTEFPKENSRVGSSSVPKVKSIHVNNFTSNSESDFKKDLDKSRDTYREFFGEEEEEEENQINSLQLPSEDKLKKSDAVAKSTSAVNISSREKPNGKTVDSHPVAASNIALRSGNGPTSDAAPATGAPAVIEDNWVCCDKCLKWRLLPHGTNPDNLPEKWLCSMLNWLPGMNRCSVTEEETTEKTKALIAQYQVPAPGGQNNHPSNPGSFMEGVAQGNFRHPDQNPQNFGLHAMPSGGKKKNASKELSKASDKDGAVQLPNSMKKNIQASLKSKSLNDVNQSPPLNEPNFQQLSNSSDMAVEKQKHKYKEKQKNLGSSYDGGETGDINNLKIKSKRDFDPDTSRASKKIKSEDRRMTDEEWASDHHGQDGEVGPSSSSGFLTTEARKDRIKDRLEAATLMKVKDEVCRDNGSVDMGNGTRDRPKKRKMKEYPEIHMGSLPTTERSVAVKEEFSENDCRKEKKARVSKSEGKESSASKGSGRTDKKSSHTKNQQRGKDLSSRQTQRSRNGMDSLKKDLGSVQVSVAATSSSSKVSGSQRTKSSFQEVKGSPVESVSSSPMRILNPDKHESVRRDLRGKDESQDAGRFTLGSPRRCSDGEDDGRSDRSGTARKEIFSSGAYHRSESSVLDVQDRDFSHISGGKARGQIVASPDITNNFPMNGVLDNSGPHTRSPSKPLTSNGVVGDQSGASNGGDGAAAVDKGVDFANYFCTYAFLYHQKEMLSDRVRMDAYYNAVFQNKHHFHGKVVLDVGTGSGILAIWSAQAGARKVYAVEATNMAEHARELVKANNVQDVVEVIQGSMEDIQLPEKVDVIISEWMGYFLLRESMFDSVICARDRWLKPTGVMYPSHARMWVAPIRSGLGDQKQNDYESSMEEWYRFTDETQAYYGVDMGALTKPFSEEQKKYYLQTSLWNNLHPNQVIGTAAILREIDCLTASVSDILELRSNFLSTVTIPNTRLCGFAGWFDVHFRGCKEIPAQKEIELTTAPSVDNGTHWGQQVFLLNPPIRVTEGDKLNGSFSMKRNKENHRLMEVEFSSEIQQYSGQLLPPFRNRYFIE